MKKYVDYRFSKGTKIVFKKLETNALWADYTTQKDNLFTSLQIIEPSSAEAFPHKDYTTFRFLNYLAAVKKTDIKVGT
jgi:hypothetical protein